MCGEDGAGVTGVEGAWEMGIFLSSSCWLVGFRGYVYDVTSGGMSLRLFRRRGEVQMGRGGMGGRVMAASGRGRFSCSGVECNCLVTASLLHPPRLRSLTMGLLVALQRLGGVFLGSLGKRRLRGKLPARPSLSISHADGVMPLDVMGPWPWASRPESSGKRWAASPALSLPRFSPATTYTLPLSSHLPLLHPIKT